MSLPQDKMNGKRIAELIDYIESLGLKLILESPESVPGIDAIVHSHPISLEELDERLVEHFLVLGFDHGVAELERGIRGLRHHTNEHREQGDRDDQLQHREAVFPGNGGAGDHGWYILPKRHVSAERSCHSLF